jgi:hypothetical protein
MKKYIIEVDEVETCPEGWTKPSSWPVIGRNYAVKDEPNYIYVVCATSVAIIHDKSVLIHSPAPTEGSVSESLLLRAIAAASRAEVLK